MKTITKIRKMKALDGRRLIFCHATSNQKHGGVTKGGWDRPRDHARTSGERDGNDEPHDEGNNDDNDKYGKDSNIPDYDNEYTLRASYSQCRPLRV
jgi:hypothetical protein